VRRLTGPEAARANARVARESLSVALGLVALKALAALSTGSLSILASLVDSLMDVLASGANLLAVRIAARPPDARHPYGHGKAEGLAGLVQGAVIGASGGYVVAEGVGRLISGAVLHHTALGIAVMAVSTVASVWIAWRLLRTARSTGSVAIAADRVHYASDVATNLGVLGALLVTRWTGWAWVDVAVAIVVGAYVLATAVRVVLRSTEELMDHEIPEGEVAALLEAIRRDVPEARNVHDLRTRKAGPDVFVELHVAFDRTLPFVEAHRLSEGVVKAVKRAIPGAEVHVHADPDPAYPSDGG
jgi:ferrous-iron efflux pump FieF